MHCSACYVVVATSAIVKLLIGSSSQPAVQAGFGGTRKQDNKLINLGIPFAVVDTNSTKQVFPKLATAFNGKANEADPGEPPSTHFNCCCIECCVID
jgi:hypothetical protein